MNSEDKLRSFLQERFDNRDVPLRDRHWMETQAYLEKKRRGRKLRSAGIPCAVIAVIAGSWMLFSRHFIPGEVHLRSTVNATVSQNVSVSVPVARDALPITHTGAKGMRANTGDHRHTTLDSEGTKRTANSQRVESDRTQGKPGQGSTSEAGKTNVTEVAVPGRGEDGIAISNENGVDPTSHTGTPAMNIEMLMPVNEIHLPPNGRERDLVIKDMAKIGTNQEAAQKDSTVVSQLAASNTTSQPLSLSAVVPGEGIYYEGGGAWYRGWKSSAGRDASGFGPLLGVNYLNRLDEKLAFSFGVQYNRVPGLGVSSKTSKVTSFGFGEESDVTVITPSALHYLVAPLRVHYFAAPRHCFGAGINPAYLLNVDADVTTYHENPNGKTDPSTTRVSGHTRGFSWYDCHASLFYRYKCTAAINVQAELFCGMVDVKDDGFFRLNGREKNSGVKISLVYYAFRRDQK